MRISTDQGGGSGGIRWAESPVSGLDAPNQLTLDTRVQLRLSLSRVSVANTGVNRPWSMEEQKRPAMLAQQGGQVVSSIQPRGEADKHR